MNDLIQTMSKQAIELVNKEHPGIGPDVWIEAYNKKFAELIVNECIQMCIGVHNDSDRPFSVPGSLHCIEDIRERFGVES